MTATVKIVEKRSASLTQVRHRASRLSALLLLLVTTFSVAVFVAPEHPARTYAVYIHPHWNSLFNQTSENTLELLARSGINTIFVDTYYPTGIGEGIFLAEKNGPWTGRTKEPRFYGAFSLDQLTKTAKKLSISVHAMISCFGEIPAIDPSNEEHRTHLTEVMEYVLEHFPAVDGIHLDYVRYMHELGLKADGNTAPVTTFVKRAREVAQEKILSAAVFAAGSLDEYYLVRYQTGQDHSEMSQYLDFICPMAYHLSTGKELGWVRSVSRFVSGIVHGRCRVLPIIQAYYQFQMQVALTPGRPLVGAPLCRISFEVPLPAMLQFNLAWNDEASRFSLSIMDPSSREAFAAEPITYISTLTRETLVMEANVTGIWIAEVRVQALPRDGDTVTVRISDLGEELPGYEVLRSAITIIMAEADGFCIYALNNLSLGELRAVRDSLRLGSGQYADLEVVYVEAASIVCGVESYSAPFAFWKRPVVSRVEKLHVPPQFEVTVLNHYDYVEPHVRSYSPVV